MVASGKKRAQSAGGDGSQASDGGKRSKTIATTGLGLSVDDDALSFLIAPQVSPVESKDFPLPPLLGYLSFANYALSCHLLRLHLHQDTTPTAISSIQASPTPPSHPGVLNLTLTHVQSAEDFKGSHWESKHLLIRANASRSSFFNGLFDHKHLHAVLQERETGVHGKFLPSLNSGPPTSSPRQAWRRSIEQVQGAFKGLCIILLL